ncbi:MAG: hypothetical protein ACR2OH_06015 [Microthrixaceae bacterium]
MRCRTALFPLAALVLVTSGCSGGNNGDADSSAGTAAAAENESAPAGGLPPVNPFLADSVVPIGHFDTAQTDSQAVAGPTGPTGELTAADLTYTHLGPAHFGIAISPEYPDGRRVIWSNGGDRISKVDYETLDVLAELPIPGKEQVTESEADELLERLDSLEGQELADEGFTLSARLLAGVAGVYYLLDEDNTLFVGGPDSIVAYRDTDPSDPESAIEVSKEWKRPNDIGGKFAGANMTHDGRIAMVTDEGWVVVVDRELEDFEAVQLVGAEAAPAHNAAMAAAGRRAGTSDWVRNSIAVDEDGGIYAVSLENLHKVVWDGSSLSTDPADGAWTEPYLNGTGAGSGATPALMGFGTEDDRFVVITDGEELMNVVLYWRDGIPGGTEAPAGAPSDRIAGQLPANMGDPDLEAIQTEQSVVVAGYGALVVDNEPASIPDGFPVAGTRVLAGLSGADPAFTPKGIQKFEWDPATGSFGEAWANRDISSANSVPVVSTGTDIVYTVGARDGGWTLEGINWDDGSSVFYWTTGSSRYNSHFSGINLDEEGRVIHTTTFGILRYEPGS